MDEADGPVTAGGSVSREAARLRAAARQGWWRRILAWFGIRTVNRQLEARAVRAAHGSLGEQWTAALLERLPAGWTVLHDLSVPGRRFNLDHVLVPPSGLGVIVLDSKKWHAQGPTHRIRGRVHCGTDDRHEQVEKVAGYASVVAQVLGLPAGAVMPFLVVHGSPVAGGWLDARVPGWERSVRVLAADQLVPSLMRMPGGRDPVRATGLAARVVAALPPYDLRA
jgi:hypothetical protein